MNVASWLDENRTLFDSDYERLFAATVLPLVSGLNLESITIQYPFEDVDGRRRYCDFVIQEGEHIRIAIEIDGYDKTGSGTGMSHAEFIDWQRRQASLTSAGWYVLRFANRDVRDEPKRCATQINRLLKTLRSRSSRPGAAGGARSQSQELARLRRKAGLMKMAVKFFSALILLLMLVIIWQWLQGPLLAVEPWLPRLLIEWQSTCPAGHDVDICLRDNLLLASMQHDARF